MPNVTDMSNIQKKGIMVAGSILVDKINEISAYPKCGELTKIKNVSMSVGGCVPNVSICLKKICPTLLVFAAGKIGADQEGKFVIENLKQNGVDVSGVLGGNEKTTFTDVMSIPGGQRTFFTYLGADSSFSSADIDFSIKPPKMLHLGYFLLLDAVDNGQGLEILKKAKENGIETSIDLVTENSNRYELVVPCLEYVDYLIINETEAGKLSGIEPEYKNLRSIAEKLKQLGVRKKVIIHFPKGAVCLSDGEFCALGSYNLPKDYIKGTTGAGDAFCAGALIGIYDGKTDKEILELASSCAVMALGESDSTSGLKSEQEIAKICKKYERAKLCL